MKKYRSYLRAVVENNTIIHSRWLTYTCMRLSWIMTMHL
ncbi:CRPV-043 [Crowpox virus]|nr:CRPV-043 [Crowpox virus]